MKRISTIAVCLLAAFALTAVAAATASAETEPAVYECAKATKNAGKTLHRQIQQQAVQRSERDGRR